MTQPNSMPAPKPPTSVMVYIGALIVAAVMIYLAFTAVNSFGLEEKTGPATVTGKAYHAAGKTYVTQRIANRTMTLPQVTPEAYLVELEILGQNTAAVVDRSVFEVLNAGDQVTAAYRRMRITGTVMVVGVSPRR